MTIFPYTNHIVQLLILLKDEKKKIKYVRVVVKKL